MLFHNLSNVKKNLLEPEPFLKTYILMKPNLIIKHI